MTATSDRNVILTTYYGPTETRGSRVVASVPQRHVGAVTTAWDYGLDEAANHAAAAATMAVRRHGADPDTVSLSGGVYEGRGYWVIERLA